MTDSAVRGGDAVTTATEPAVAKIGQFSYSPALPTVAKPQSERRPECPVVAVELIVSDTGAGIEPDILPRLFEGLLDNRFLN